MGSIPNISFGWLTCECTCVRALCVGVWLSACRHMYAHKHANQPPHGPKVYPAAHDIDVQSPALSPSSRAAAVWQLCSVPPILTCNPLGCIVPGAVTFGSTASLFAVPPVCLSLPVPSPSPCPTASCPYHGLVFRCPSASLPLPRAMAEAQPAIYMALTKPCVAYHSKVAGGRLVLSRLSVILFVQTLDKREGRGGRIQGGPRLGRHQLLSVPRLGQSLFLAWVGQPLGLLNTL